MRTTPIAALLLMLVALPLLAQEPATDTATVYDPLLRVQIDTPPRLLVGAQQTIDIVIDGLGERSCILTATARAMQGETRELDYALFTTSVSGDGLHQPTFNVPALPEGNCAITLIATTDSGIQRVSIVTAVQAAAVVMYVSTDKPIYQPGQTIRIRVLALDPLTNTTLPQGVQVNLELRNAQSILAWSRQLPTDAYGVVADDCPLDGEAPTGEYTLTARVGKVENTLQIVVRRYQLPKFRVDVVTQATYFRPGDAIRGTINARYTFGEPVKEAIVDFVMVVFDPVNGWELGTIGTAVRGTTNEQGQYEFVYRLPERQQFGGVMGLDETCTVSCRAVVTDTSNIVEVGYAMRTCSVHPLIATLVPENQTLLPKSPNRMFLRLEFPDGSPARAEVRVGRSDPSFEAFYEFDPKVKFETNHHGVGEFTMPIDAEADFLSRTFQLQIVDTDGNQLRVPWSWRRQVYRGEQQATAKTPPMLTPQVSWLLLRPTKTWLREGEAVSVRLTDVAPAIGDDQPTIYTTEGYVLEVRKFGLLLSSTRLGIGELISAEGAPLQLPLELFGQVDIVLNRLVAHRPDSTNDKLGPIASHEIRAGVAACSLFIVKDDELIITVEPDQDTYAPGDRNARLRFRAERRSGERGPAILGVDIVDEAIYALQEREREQLRLALYLKSRALAERVRVALIDPELDDANRQLLARLLFSATAEPPDIGAHVDSLTYAIERTQTVLNNAYYLIESNLTFMAFQGHLITERKAESEDERKRFEWTAEVWDWLVEFGGDEAGGDDARISLDDFEDAWGNRIWLVRGYGESGDRRDWRLVSAGPDGRLALRGESKGDDVMYSRRFNGPR